MLNYLVAYVRKLNPTCVFLSEMQRNTTRVEKLHRRLKFRHYEISEAKEELNMECVYKSERIICWKEKDWRMVGCYRPPHFHLIKRAFWNGLGDFFGKLFKLPWILFGDLNEFVEASEKWGGKDSKQKSPENWLAAG